MAFLNFLVFLLCWFMTQRPVHFLSMCFNAIKWDHKTRQVYDPETQMVPYAHFLHLSVDGYYNYNMKSIDLSDQLRCVYRVDRWMRKYKWWRYLLFWIHCLVLVRLLHYLQNTMRRGQGESHGLLCRDHLVSAVQQQGIFLKVWVYTYYYYFRTEGRYKKKRQDQNWKPGV